MSASLNRIVAEACRSVAQAIREGQTLARDQAMSNDLLSIPAQERGVTHDDVQPGMPGFIDAVGTFKPVVVDSVKRRLRDGYILKVWVKSERPMEEDRVFECVRRVNNCFYEVQK